MTEVVVAQRMWQRRGTAAEWSAENPVLAAGEIGIELPATGTLCLSKTGDGVTHWNDLPYAAEPFSAPGTTAQYRRGDKTWRDFATDVRAAVLTGLSTASAATITATDSVLSSLGKLQAQVSAILLSFITTPFRFAPASGSMDVGIDVVAGSTADFTWLRGGAKQWQFRLNTSNSLDFRYFVAGVATLAARWDVTTGVLDFAAKPTVNDLAINSVDVVFHNADTTLAPSDCFLKVCKTDSLSHNYTVSPSVFVDTDWIEFVNHSATGDMVIVPGAGFNLYDSAKGAAGSITIPPRGSAVLRFVSGSSAYLSTYTDAYARAAVIASSISNGDTTHSPSGDAVFDALALKGDLAGAQTWTGANTFQTANTVFYSVSDSDGPGNSLRRQRATGTGALASGDRIGFYNFQGYNGSGYPIAASVESYTLEAYTGTANGAKLAFFTCAVGATTRVRRWEVDETAFYPFADNTYQAGKSGARIKEVWCANSVINTSDAREKSEPRPLTDIEIAVARALALLPCVFKFLASIREKGEDAARWHVSPTVQAVMAVFEAHGLDPFAYGMVCYDQWEETREPAQYETVELEPAVTVDHPAIYERTQVYSEEGQPERFAERLVTPAWTEVVTPAVTEERLVREEIIHPAGDRYSLRGTELSHFIAAAQAQTWAAESVSS
jgi:hypothetical protein